MINAQEFLELAYKCLWLNRKQKLLLFSFPQGALQSPPQSYTSHLTNFLLFFRPSTLLSLVLEGPMGFYNLQLVEFLPQM